MIERPDAWTGGDVVLLVVLVALAVAWFELWERRQLSPWALWSALSGEVEHDDMVLGPRDGA